MVKSLLISSLVLNIGLLLGRLSGFLRESIVATTYGVSSEADIVVLMLTVPDLLVNILVGGAMGVVLIPQFRSNPDCAKKLLFQAMLFFGSVFTLISLLLYWQSHTLVALLAPGFDSIQTHQASSSVGWVIWLIPITVLAGISSAYLHSNNKFAMASLGTLIINTVIAIGLLLIYFGYGSLFWLAMFILLGGVLRLFSQLLGSGLHWRVKQYFDVILLNKTILWRYMQALLSGSILLFIPVLARAFSSYSGEGGVAVMNYALRLIEFPMAIAITVFIVVLFPRLSDSFINDSKLYQKIVHYGVQLALGIAVLITIVLTLLSHDYVEVVFNHGNMQEEDLLRITELINIGLLALPLQGLSFFFERVFHSQKNTKTPLLINSIALLAFVLIYISHIFGEDLQAILWGLVFSYGLVCILQIGLLRALLRKSLRAEFIVALLVASILLYALSDWLSYAGFDSIITLFIAVIAGLASMVMVALFNSELRSLLKRNVPKT